MAELMDYVGVMADQIGPRPVSTEEEHQTSLYIAQELSDDGYDVDVDEFATPTGTRWPYAIAFVATILGALISGVGIFVRGISLTMFVLGIVLIVVGLFIYYTEINNKPVLSKMRAGGVSQNVVARYVPSSVRREQRRRKVIVVAHVDTVRAELEAAPALVKYTALLRRIVYYVMIGIAVLTVVRLLPLPWPSVVDTVLWGISLVGCVYLLAATVCIVARRFTPYVSGGNDNASADAVLLGVAKRLLDPEERARHAARRKAQAEAAAPQGPEGAELQTQGQTVDPAQTVVIPQQDAATVQTVPESAEAPASGQVTGAVEAQQPVMHSAEVAYAAGVVPEGASVSYEAAAVAAEETTVLPPIDGAAEQQETVQGVPGQVVEEPEAGLGATQALSRDELDEVLGKTAAIPQPEYPEIVEDPKADAQAQQATEPVAAPAQEAGYKPLPDSLFAQSPEESVQAQVAPAQDQASKQQGAQAGKPAAAPAPEVPAAQTAVQEQQADAPAPEKAQRKGKQEKNVPSWYKAAKEKAAKDMQARGAENEGGEATAQPEGFRSRYAQIPVSGSMANVRRAMIQEEEVAEEKGELKEPAPQQAETAEAENAAEPVQAAESSEPAKFQGAELQPEQAASASAEQEPQTIDFGFLDDEIDDISPDMSGVFTAIEAKQSSQQDSIAGANEIRDELPKISPSESDRGAAREQEDGSERGAVQAIQDEAQTRHAEAPAAEKTGILKGLTSRIPIIGSSDQVAGASGQGARADEPAAPEAPEQAQRPKPKPERRKPTARHITQEFQPTRPANERNGENEKLSSMRQEVAVSSTYEDTPQAGPEYDPFVPKDEQPYDAYGNANPSPSAPFPSLSNQAASGAAGGFGNPGGSSSFPSLSGQIPQVNPSDFGDSYDVDYGYEPTSEDVAEDFGNPNLTGEINIPDSRFHNAIDKVSGLFSHKDKKSKRGKKHSRHDRPSKQEEEGYDAFDGGNVDNWDEDDDFGWKGGAYVPEDYEYDSDAEGGSEPRHGSALEAAKARAAEIRDSVIEMTERDLLDKEVWFVALGASGAGNQGMKNFLELHGPELRGSLVINLEAVGAGTIHYVDSEGTGKSRKCDRRLQSLVRKASKNLDGVEMRPQKLEWRNTDATPAMAAGLRAMTIMGFDGPVPVAWHWSDDTSDIVDPENLEYVTELVLDMIENS